MAKGKSLGILAMFMAVLLLVAAPALVAGKATSATKIPILDDTQNGIGPADPTIGFVVYNQDDTGKLIIVVSLKQIPMNAITPKTTYEVQLVQSGTNPNGGITSEPGGHFGLINVLGNITTNNQGKGTATFHVDVTTLAQQIPGLNYGHINIEDSAGAVNSAIPGNGLVANQIGAAAVSWYNPAPP